MVRVPDEDHVGGHHDDAVDDPIDDDVDAWAEREVDRAERIADRVSHHEQINRRRALQAGGGGLALVAYFVLKGGCRWLRRSSRDGDDGPLIDPEMLRQSQDVADALDLAITDLRTTLPVELTAFDWNRADSDDPGLHLVFTGTLTNTSDAPLEVQVIVGILIEDDKRLGGEEKIAVSLPAGGTADFATTKPLVMRLPVARLIQKFLIAVKART